MDPEDAELARVVGEVCEAAHGGQGDHPSTDELLAYHERALGPEATEALRDHLALCPDCAQRALDLAILSLPEDEEDDDGSEGSQEEGWAELRDILDEEGLLREPKVSVGESPEATRSSSLSAVWRPSVASLRWAYATAALFFVTSLALSILLVQAHQIGEFRPDLQLVDLRPVQAAERTSGASREEIDLRTRGVVFNLVTRTEIDETGGEYRLEIFDRARPELPVRPPEPLTRNENGAFTFLISEGFLTPGSYRIKLYRPDGSLLHEYLFELLASSPT